MLASFAAMSIPALAADKSYTLTSPDGQLGVTVQAGSQLTYTVSRGGLQLLAPSPISMTLGDGRAFGPGDKVRKVTRAQADNWLDASV